ncbi:MAG: FAD-dependent oxidoreductase [Pseudomonadota bacterium]
MTYPGSNFDDLARGLLAPTDYQNPTPKARYHLVVIGAGPAGLITAIGAAGLGAKVALVEKHRMGGDCLNVGCVPSKALLEYTEATPAPEFGPAFAWLREVRAGIAPHDSVERYREAGVDVFIGSATVHADHVMVGEQRLNARRIAVTTGARAAVPPIPGLRESGPLTNEDVFDLTDAPASIGILGAGAIGCELALVFARLGVGVHLFELADRVLPLEVPEASAAVAAALEAKGVVLHVGAGVAEVKAAGELYEVVNQEGAFAVERVLVALGRRPNTDGLFAPDSGVSLDERGFVQVDAKLRSSNKNIFAAGDCIGGLQFTHHADAQARALIQNALIAPTAKVDGLVVPHCTYTKPEVAGVGITPDSASVPLDTYRFDFSELDRGRAELDGNGFAEVYTAKGSDQILGATIVGHDAGEQIAPIGILMSNGMGLSTAGKALYSYPTRSEYLKRLADAYNRSRLTPFVAGIFQRWLDFLVK